MNSRLGDLGITETKQEAPVEAEFMKDFFADVESIKGNIAAVSASCEVIAGLIDRAERATKTSEDEAISAELQACVDPTNRQAHTAKDKLRQIKQTTDRLEADLASGKNANIKQSELRIRKNVHGTLTQKFVAVMREYQGLQQEFQSKIKETVARRVRVVKPDASHQEIQQVMESGDYGKAIYREAILAGGSGKLIDTYRNCADKYQDVKRLERSVAELQQMFIDLAFLVEQQGEMLDQIEFQVNSAAEYIAEGNEEIRKATDSRKKLRKKYCCLAIVLLVIIGVIMVPVLINTLPKN